MIGPAELRTNAFGRTPLVMSYPCEIWPYRLRSRGVTVVGVTTVIAIVFNIFVNPIALEVSSFQQGEKQTSLTNRPGHRMEVLFRLHLGAPRISPDGVLLLPGDPRTQPRTDGDCIRRRLSGSAGFEGHGRQIEEHHFRERRRDVQARGDRVDRLQPNGGAPIDFPPSNPGL